MTRFDSRIVRGIFCCFAVSIATAGTSRAATVRCFDNFNAADPAWVSSAWQSSVDPSMIDPQHSITKNGSRFNGGIVRGVRMHQVFMKNGIPPGSYPVVASTHVKCFYNPSPTMATINVTFRVENAYEEPLFFRPLIVQDGKNFVPNGGVVGSSQPGEMKTWTKTFDIGAFGLLNANGSLNLLSRPDLSCSGGALSFGYHLQAVTGPPRPLVYGAYIDEWESTIESTPGPSGLVFSFPYNGVFQTNVPASPTLSGVASGTVQAISDLPGGHTGEALHLEADGKIKFAGDAAVNFGTSDFSIDAWIRTKAHSGTNVLIDNRVALGPNPTYGTRGIRLFTYVGRIGLTLSTGPTDNFISLKNIADNKWHHVSVTVDRDSTTGGRIYVDGDLVNPYIFNPNSPKDHQGSLGTGQDMVIGHEIVSNTEGLPFDIDEVEFFSRALTPDEVQTLAQQPKCKS